MLQDMHVTRFLFIREFTKQLIINSKPKEEILQTREIREAVPVFQKPKELEVPIPSYLQKPVQKIFQTQQMPVNQTIRMPPQMPIKKPQLPKTQANQGMTLSILDSEPGKLSGKTFPTQELNGAEITPAIEKVPQGFNLGKIDFLARDPKVNAVECLGPDKFVIVRVFGKINSTKIKLNQQEIQGIIQRFSKATKIPIISGLFKAAVGNLVITAVISDIVGSRFIITRVTPFQF